MALFGYTTPVIGTTRTLPSSTGAQLVIDPANRLNVALTSFYRSLDWPADRVHVETRYERLLMDDFSLRDHHIPNLNGWREETLTTLAYDWPLHNFVQYLNTWSGYRRLLATDATNSSLLQSFVEAAEAEAGSAETICVDFGIFAVFYQKDH